MHKHHSATYGDFARAANLDAPLRIKLMKTLANKTEAEQLEIFAIKHDITNHIITSNPKQTNELHRYKSEQPDVFDYCLLLVAIQLHEADVTKSEFTAQVREQRQDPLSFKTAPLAKTIKSMIPLIDELKRKGATWEQVAHTLNTKKKRMMSNRKISVDYLKKTYAKIKRDTSSIVCDEKKKDTSE